MADQEQFPLAPELMVSEWFNTDTSITLANLRDKVVIIEAFQMLCPGCVSHGLPQAQRIYETFPKEKVVVLGLHTVFEHHDAMPPVALKAFIYEYGLRFPIGVDQSGENPTPKTMQAYQLQGTPSLLLIDRQGKLRAQHFGQVPDLRLGAQIEALLGQDNQN